MAHLAIGRAAQGGDVQTALLALAGDYITAAGTVGDARSRYRYSCPIVPLAKRTAGSGSKAAVVYELRRLLVDSYRDDEWTGSADANGRIDHLIPLVDEAETPGELDELVALAGAPLRRSRR